MFADKATLVSRMLFYSEPRGVRETSTMLGDLGFSLTAGYVSKVANSLIAEHYARRTEEGIELNNKESFLEEWVSVYKRMRARQETEGWYYPTGELGALACRPGSHLQDFGVLTERAEAFLSTPTHPLARLTF